jgi:hypothetical protein
MSIENTTQEQTNRVGCLAVYISTKVWYASVHLIKYHHGEAAVNDAASDFL